MTHVCNAGWLWQAVGATLIAHMGILTLDEVWSDNLFFLHMQTVSHAIGQHAHVHQESLSAWCETLAEWDKRHLCMAFGNSQCCPSRLGQKFVNCAQNEYQQSQS